MEAVFDILPLRIKDLIIKLPKSILDNMEEVRLRINRNIEIAANGIPHYLPYVFEKKDADHFMDKIANFSFYTLDEELRKGYITIAGGHRIGLAGKVILEQGAVKAIRHISSFNIRIAREKIGVAKKYIEYLVDTEWKNTMIIGPPQTGKTTLLRDLARIVSSGTRVAQLDIPAKKVGVVDERSEIAGCVHGTPQLQFGQRIDILDACPKAEGMMMLIRSMSPDVLIVDEIGREEDSHAIMEAVHAGITLMMTTHGNSFDEISQRPLLKGILSQKVFDRYIELSRAKGPGTMVAIKDHDGKPILLKKLSPCLS